MQRWEAELVQQLAALQLRVASLAGVVNDYAEQLAVQAELAVCAKQLRDDNRALRFERRDTVTAAQLAEAEARIAELEQERELSGSAARAHRRPSTPTTEMLMREVQSSAEQIRVRGQVLGGAGRGSLKGVRQRLQKMLQEERQRNV